MKLRIPFAVWLSMVTAAMVVGPIVPCQTAWAAEIYKCRDAAGKPVYTSDSDAWTDCRPVELKVIEPSPEEVSRAIEEQQRKAEEDLEAEERAREESLLRAREAESEAAMRRARAAEEELRLLKQQGAVNPQPSVPYWFWGPGVVMPRHHHPVRRNFPHEHERPPHGVGGQGTPPSDGSGHDRVPAAGSIENK